MITHWLQFPHFAWAGDCGFNQATIFGSLGPFFNFMLYAIDLIEIPAIIVVTLAFIARYKNRK